MHQNTHSIYLQIFPEVSIGDIRKRCHHNNGSVQVGQAHLPSDIVTSELYTPVVFVSWIRIHRSCYTSDNELQNYDKACWSAHK